MKVIVYIENSNACVMSIASGLDMSIEEIAARNVPSSCKWIVVDAESLPPGGLQETWFIEDGAVVVDSGKMNLHLALQAEANKKLLKLKADSEIAWRQDAVDVDIATEKEATELAGWKKYRVLLMRVDTAAPDWPTVPVS